MFNSLHGSYLYMNKIFYYKMDDIYNDKDIIIHRNDKRSFTSFSSIESFTSWYLTIPSQYRCFDEVVTSYRKFILDIDCRDVDSIDWDTMIYYCKSQIMSHFNDPNIMIYNSHSTDILSSHIIVTNYMMDYNMCYSIASSLYDSIPVLYSRYIDMGVYKKVQFMRLEGSRKQSSNRYLYLSGCNRISDLRISMLGYATEGSTYIESRNIVGRKNISKYKPISNIF